MSSHLREVFDPGTVSPRADRGPVPGEVRFVSGADVSLFGVLGRVAMEYIGFMITHVAARRAHCPMLATQ